AGESGNTVVVASAPIAFILPTSQGVSCSQGVDMEKGPRYTLGETSTPAIPRRSGETLCLAMTHPDIRDNGRCGRSAYAVLHSETDVADRGGQFTRESR